MIKLQSICTYTCICIHANLIQLYDYISVKALSVTQPRHDYAKINVGSDK